MIRENVCFLDIETLVEDAVEGMDPTCAPGWEAPKIEDLVEEPKRRTCPANYGDAAAERWESKESTRYSAAVRDAWLAAHEAIQLDRAKTRETWAKGSLSPLRGRVACISLAFGERAVQVIECADDERGGLWALNAELGRVEPDVIVTHNGFGFDYEFLWKRALKHRIPDLSQAMRQGKPWDGYLVDTMRMFGPGYREYHSLDTVCAFLDIERAPSTIDGSGVLDAYLSGRWAEVVEHAAADIVDLRNVYRRLIEAA